jgi:hypothetical protein
LTQPLEASLHPRSALGLIIPLSVTGVLEVLGAGVERQEPLQKPVVDRQRDYRASRRIAACEVAALEEVVQDRLGLAAGIDRYRNDGHLLLPRGCLRL